MDDEFQENPNRNEAERRSADLLQRFFDGEITDEEAVELHLIWAQHPQLHRDIVANYHLHHDLGALAFEETDLFSRSLRGDSQDEITNPEKIDWQALIDLAASCEKSSSVDEETKVESVARKEKKIVAYDTSQKRSFIFHPLFVLTLLSLFAITVYRELHPMNSLDTVSNEKWNPIAVLTDTADVVWEEDCVPPTPGKPILSGSVALKSGNAELLFFDGTRMVLDDRSHVVFLNNNRIFCKQGNLSLTVPPSGVGFEVHTPHAVFKDLGTEFFVQVMPTASEVQVVKGLVELKQYDAGPIRLGVGQAAYVDSYGTTENRVWDISRFISTALMKKRVASCSLHLDARKRLQNKPTMQPKYRLMLGDRLPEGVTRFGGDLISDEHHGPAFRFSKREDRVRFSHADFPDSATFAAWVRVDRLDLVCNPILMSEGTKPGGFLWQISSEGQLSFGLRNRNNQKLEPFFSPIVLTPDKLGQWIHLAITIDRSAKTMAHYMNGEIVCVLPFHGRQAFSLRNVDIGNWCPKSEPIKNLDGAIGEIRIYDNALSHQEIYLLASERKNDDDSNNEP